MGSSRTPVPGMDSLLRSTARPEPTVLPVNAKISVYLPAGLLDQVDDYRTALRKECGVRVDRSRVIRDLLRACLDSKDVLDRLQKEERD